MATPVKVYEMSEESSHPSPPPLPPSPLEKLNDFSDRFSPMLVKELRQGLRTHTFVILFLILQGLLALILLTTAAANSNVGSIVSSLIFFLFSIAVLIVQPLRGMSAISSEVKADTIDLMALTKLSAWRIVFGKWSSIVSQTALLLFTIIPYLILRYFFGGMQLFSELLLLLTIFLCSGVLTAVTVGLSASTLAFIRAIPLLAAFFLFWLIRFFSFEGFNELLEFLTPNRAPHWLALLGGYLIAVFIGYFFMEIAATAIAPSAENRATRKRLIALVVVPLVFIVFHPLDDEVAWSLALALLAMLSLDYFTESNDYPSVVVRPFLRFGPLGRLAARLLAPGWATGTLFYLFLIAIIVGISLVTSDELLSKATSFPILSILGVVLGMLCLPLFLVHFFQKRITNRLVAYLLFSLLLLGLIPLFLILDNIGDIKTMIWALCFLPQAQPFLVNHTSAETHALIIWISTASYLTLCLLYTLRPLKKLSSMEREERQRLATDADADADAEQAHDPRSA